MTFVILGIVLGVLIIAGVAGWLLAPGRRARPAPPSTVEAPPEVTAPTAPSAPTVPRAPTEPSAPTVDVPPPSAGRLVRLRSRLSGSQSALGRGLPMPDPDDEIDTIAGLVAAIAGRMPERGEIIQLAAGLDAEITDADPRRIKRLRLRPVAPPASPPPAEA